MVSPLLSSSQVIAACSTDTGVKSYREPANGSMNIDPIKLDLSNDDEIQACAELLAAQYPEGLYALVNNNNNTVVGKDGLVEWMTIDNYKMYVIFVSRVTSRSYSSSLYQFPLVGWEPLGVGAPRSAREANETTSDVYCTTLPL